MKITKRQLRRIIREEKALILREQNMRPPGDADDPPPGALDHHWPTRAEWNEAPEIADEWADMERRSFSTGDPSMNQGGELSDSEAKKWWNEQIDAAHSVLVDELNDALSKAAQEAMEAVTDRLIDGEFS